MTPQAAVKLLAGCLLGQKMEIKNHVRRENLVKAMNKEKKKQIPRGVIIYGYWFVVLFLESEWDWVWWDEIMKVKLSTWGLTKSETCC